ncbi:hypothetical protein MACJ_000706 [Theileria orientalis]|uniref:Uncharacterized protein n=1 Tax=Theileria orientalis TaxID=68886 RepID=A0A976M4J6_THEOR|nr:hypothetical protein MACJ_000706 [Theileria orientalis]
MCDESEDSFEIPINSTIGPLYNNNNINILDKLQELCERRTHKLSIDVKGLTNNSNFEFKFKNCFELLQTEITPYKKGSKCDKYNFVKVFFKFVKKSFGIAQIVGSSGSGKTSICLKIAQNIPGTVLYLDISGSFDPTRAPSSQSFIPLRLYTLEELTLFLNDFERRLSQNNPLCDILDLSASSVEMIIIDSLWCVDQIDKFHRQEYLFNLSLILRRISWKYNISVIVCINYTHKFNKLTKQLEYFTTNLSKDNTRVTGDNSALVNKKKNEYSKWDSNCYVKFILNYKTINQNINHLNKEKEYVPLRTSDDSSFFHTDQLPWKSTEIDIFRKFLLYTKTRSGTKISDSKNLCIIKGQTGSGKVTTVRRLCREMNIKVVEFDPFDTPLGRRAEYDSTVDNLIRFLQSSLSRRTLKSTSVDPIVTESVSVGGRGPKRIKSSRNEYVRVSADRYGKKGISSDDSEEGQLALIYDLPRALLNCKYTSLYPIQNMLNELLNSDSIYPLVIVTLDTKEDSTILRRMLPSNYARDPRCLVLTLKEISKTKIFSLLKLKKSTLVNHIIDISSGDIRYILNNLKFYNIGMELGKENIYEYMLERNNLNNFSLLGKILFNKRVPIKIPGCSEVGNTDITNNSVSTSANVDTSPSDGNRRMCSSEPKTGDNTPTGGSYIKMWTVGGINQWFNISDSLSPCYSVGLSMRPSYSSSNLYIESKDDSNMTSPSNTITGALSPATGTISNINDPASSVENVNYKDVINYLKYNICFSMCRAVRNEPVSEKESNLTQSSGSSQEKGLDTQDKLKRLINKVPLGVKLDGITEEFDPKRPMSYTMWPKIIPEDDAPGFRLSASRMLPKLTRPVLRYRPEELVDSIKSDPNYFTNCLFDNYSDMYGSIDDCCALTRHFTSADVFNTSNIYMQDQEAVRQFLSICIRAAADSNIHGFDLNRRGFRQFMPHSNYRVKMDQIKELIQEFKLEASRRQAVQYTQESLLVEIIPVLSMATAEEEALTEVYSQTQSQPLTTDDEYDILDVMEQVEMMLEKGEKSETKEPRGFKQSSIFTSELNHIVREISKYYKGRASQHTGVARKGTEGAEIFQD